MTPVGQNLIGVNRPARWSLVWLLREFTHSLALSPTHSFIDHQVNSCNFYGWHCDACSRRRQRFRYKGKLFLPLEEISCGFCVSVIRLDGWEDSEHSRRVFSTRQRDPVYFQCSSVGLPGERERLCSHFSLVFFLNYGDKTEVWMRSFESFCGAFASRLSHLCE